MLVSFSLLLLWASIKLPDLPQNSPTNYPVTVPSLLGTRNSEATNSVSQSTVNTEAGETPTPASKELENETPISSEETSNANRIEAPTAPVQQAAPQFVAPTEADDGDGDVDNNTLDDDQTVSLKGSDPVPTPETTKSEILGLPNMKPTNTDAAATKSATQPTSKVDTTKTEDPKTTEKPVATTRTPEYITPQVPTHGGEEDSKRTTTTQAQTTYSKEK